MSVLVSSRDDRRRSKRFHISCPITVMLRVRGRNAWREQGHLCDIGTNGARFQLNRQLSVGQILVLLVHFQDSGKGVTTVRFLGTVTRAEAGSVPEIAVRFRRGGQFLRHLAEVRGSQQLASPKADSAPWIN